MFITANIISDALQPLIDFFGAILVSIHGVIGNWGWSIIAMTFLIRLVLLPLTIKQVKSMQAMQKLQPEIKKIQSRYKSKPGASAEEKAKNRQELNQELQRFYRENEINPLMSCLPLLAQMPVFISLFYLLRQQLKTDICPSIKQWAEKSLTSKDIAGLHAKAVKTATSASEVKVKYQQLYTEKVNSIVGKHVCGDVDAFVYQGHAYPKPTAQQFLFIPDLTAKATGGVLIALLVLYVGTQLGSSLLMSATQDKMQRNLMLLMPLAFVFFIISFPAGLILYWITTNTWTIGQQFVVKRLTGGLTPAAASPAGMAAAADEPEDGVSKPPRNAKKDDSGPGDGSPKTGGSEKPKQKGKGGPPPRKSTKKRTGRRR